MRGYKTLLAAGAAALISTAALAEERKVLKVSNALDEITIVEDADEILFDVIDQVQNKFEVDQFNSGDIAAHTEVNATNVTDYTASAVAIANNTSVDVIGSVGGAAWQNNSGDVSATMNANVMNAMGATELTAVAIANNFSVNVAEYGGAVISSTQVNTGDVSAGLHASVTGQVQDVTTTAVAIANNTSIQVPNGGQILTGVEQYNHGDVTAYNNTTLRPMRRVIDPAVAVAIGNNASISNYVPVVQ